MHEPNVRETFLFWRNGENEDGGDDDLHTVLTHGVDPRMDRHQQTRATTEVHSQTQLQISQSESLKILEMVPHRHGK